MKVCVTGGTGFVGRGVLPALLSAGHTVHALVRPGSEAKLPASEGCIRFAGDPLDFSSVKQALLGCDAAIHLVGIRRVEMKKSGLSYDDIDVASAQVMGDAMLECHLGRILLLSAGAIGNSIYVQSKARAERAIVDTKLDWTIFRPAFVLGPGQQWPRVMAPMLTFLSWLPGRIADVAYRAGNVTREQLSASIVWALENQEAVGMVLDVPGIRRTADYQFHSSSHTVGKPALA